MPLIPRAAAPLQKHRPSTILSVGRRAYVNCRGRIALAEDDGRTSQHSLVDGAAALFERFTQRGLQVMIRDQGELRPATAAEHGWTQD